MDLNLYMTSCRNSIILLIKKYRINKDEVVMENLQRMLEWRRDMIKYKELKEGVTVSYMTEPYYPMLPMPHWDKSIQPLMPLPSIKFKNASQ